MIDSANAENAQPPVAEEVQTNTVESGPKKFTVRERFTSVFSFSARNSQFLQNPAIFSTSILALGAATVSLTFFIGSAGYSLAGQTGASFCLAIGAAFLIAARVGLNKLENLIKTPVTAVVDADKDASEELNTRGATVVAGLQAANDKSKSESSESVAEAVIKHPRLAATNAKEAIHTQTAPTESLSQKSDSADSEAAPSSTHEIKKSSRKKKK